MTEPEEEEEAPDIPVTDQPGEVEMPVPTALPEPETEEDFEEGEDNTENTDSDKLIEPKNRKLFQKSLSLSVFQYYLHLLQNLPPPFPVQAMSEPASQPPGLICYRNISGPPLLRFCLFLLRICLIPNSYLLWQDHGKSTREEAVIINAIHAPIILFNFSVLLSIASDCR